MTGAQKAAEEARMRALASAGGTASVAYCEKMQMPWGSTECGS